MFTISRSRMREFCHDDHGVAMVAVIGVVVIMTIIAVAAYSVASQNLTTTLRVNQDTQAFQAANSGIDRALARIQVNGYRDTDYPLTGTLSTTKASYVATVQQAPNSEFLAISTGTDPSGRTETIKVKFFYLNMWNMNLAAGSNNSLGGGAVRGTTSVYGPFYVRGTVELNSNSTIENGPLFIKGGSLFITGSGMIGGNGPIDVYVTGSYPPVGSKGMNARSVSQSVPDITLPLLDLGTMQASYNAAKAESIDNVRGYSDSGIQGAESTGGNPQTYPTMLGGGWTRPRAPGATDFYKVVGANATTTIGPLGAGTHGLTVGGTGSWGSYPGDGHYPFASPSHDDFSFNDATNVLTVEGTVFVDGPLIVNESVTYQGNGTLICNGDITLNGDFVPATGDRHPDATHVLGLVTPGSIVCNSGDNNLKDPAGSPTVAGAFFASRDWTMTRNVLVKGSVLAAGIDFTHANQHLVTDPDLPKYLPRGMPGSGSFILTKGAWVR